MGNVIHIGDSLLPKPKWRQVPVAYGRLALRGTLPAGQWAIQPPEPFRINYLLTWLADSAPGAKLSAFQISALDQFQGVVPARVFEASISIEELLAKYLKCSGTSACVLCHALAHRVPSVEFANIELVRTPRGFVLDGLPVVEVGGRAVVEHGELSGIALIGVAARASES